MALSATQLQRALATEKATKVVENEHAKRRLSFGLTQTCRQKDVGQTEMLRRLLSGSPVIVYRTVTKSSQMPIPLHKILWCDSSSAISTRTQDLPIHLFETLDESLID